jgi:hypothetical protein
MLAPNNPWSFFLFSYYRPRQNQCICFASICEDIHDRNLTKPDIIDVSHQIVESDLGCHYALAYSGLPVLKQFYCEYIRREVQYHEGCILFLTFYESPRRQVKHNLTNANVNISKHEQDSSLRIFDILGILFGTFPYQLNLNPLKLILEQLQKTAKTKCVSLIIDTSPFYDLGKIGELITFEKLFAFDFFRHNWKGVCLYCQQNLECVAIAERKELAKYHATVFRS